MIRLFAIRLTVILVAVAVLASLEGLIDGDPEHAKPPKTGRPATVHTGTPATTPAVNGADPETTGTIVLVVAYLDELERTRLEQEAVAAYLDALESTRQADLAAAEATRLAQARQTAAPQPASNRTPSTPVTGQCGGATNGADQYIARESGGSPTIYNAGGSGAWGCYQIMPGTWQSSCSDVGAYGSASPAQQAACASRLPLSAWGG